MSRPGMAATLSCDHFSYLARSRLPGSHGRGAGSEADMGGPFPGQCSGPGEEGGWDEEDPAVLAAAGYRRCLSHYASAVVWPDRVVFSSTGFGGGYAR